MALTDPESPPADSAPTSLRRTGFSTAQAIVGRDAELTLLADAVNAVRRQGAAFLVSGEPGVGVTPLLEAAGARARSAGRPVLTTAGNKAETGMPFAALHRLLRPILS